MGWTTTCAYRGGGIKAYLDARFASDDPRFPKYDILESAMHGMTEYYAAARRIDRETGEEVVFALVALVSYKSRDPEGYTLGWKEMTDSMGPQICNCPIRILELLDPPFNDYSREWRMQCRANAANAERLKTALVHGAIIEFADPLTFVSGKSYQRFTVVKRKRTVRFRAPDGVMCRISKLAHRDWRVVDPAEAGGDTS